MMQDNNVQPVKRGRPKMTDIQKAKKAKRAELVEKRVTLSKAQWVINAMVNPTDANVEKMATTSMQEVRSNISALTKEQDIVQVFIKKSIGVIAKSGQIVDRKLSQILSQIDEDEQYLDTMSIKDIKDIADIGSSQAKAIAILTGQTPEQAVSQQTNNTVVFVDAGDRANALLSAFLKGNR